MCEDPYPDANFDELNERRMHLILKEMSSQLTKDEDEELGALQTTTGDMLSEKFKDETRGIEKTLASLQP